MATKTKQVTKPTTTQMIATTTTMQNNSKNSIEYLSFLVKINGQFSQLGDDSHRRDCPFSCVYVCMCVCACACACVCICLRIDHWSMIRSVGLVEGSAVDSTGSPHAVVVVPPWVWLRLRHLECQEHHRCYHQHQLAWSGCQSREGTRLSSLQWQDSN